MIYCVSFPCTYLTASLLKLLWNLNTRRLWNSGNICTRVTAATAKHTKPCWNHFSNLIWQNDSSSIVFWQSNLLPPFCITSAACSGEACGLQVLSSLLATKAFPIHWMFCPKVTPSVTQCSFILSLHSFLHQSAFVVLQCIFPAYFILIGKFTLWYKKWREAKLNLQWDQGSWLNPGY